MVRVIALNDDSKRVAKAMEKYFDVATPEEVDKIMFDIFSLKKNLAQRKKVFARHKKTILALKPLFKQLVIELNKVAKKGGYKNHFDFTSKNDGIPKEKLELFFKKVDRVIKAINEKFPPPPKNFDWYWSEYNLPDPLCLVTKKRYSIPDDIFKMIKKKDPKVAVAIPRIKIKKLKDFYPQTKYDKKKKTVTIYISTKETDIHNTLKFVHELGHALVMLGSVDKNIDLSGKSRYWHEKEGIKETFALEKTLLSKKVREASQADFLLGFFTLALFEYEIYNNPDQDFDKVYAKAINRCYLKAKQRENPFYVLKNTLTTRSCASALYSVAAIDSLHSKP